MLASTARLLGPALLGSLLLLSTTAAAITLEDLDNGASISSGDGRITFENWSVSTPDPFDGSPNAFVGLDLSIFEVDVEETGVLLKVVETTGPLVVFGGAVGNLVISFDAVTDELTTIEGVGLGFTGTAQGAGALAGIAEAVVGSEALLLDVVRVGGGPQEPFDFASFSSSPNEVTVTKSIVLDTRGPDALLAQISEFEQSFELAPIPEPGAAALFAVGALVVFHAGLRRKA